MQQDIQRILAMRMDNIGDVIMTGPALQAIRSAWPHSHLTLMAGPSGAQAAALLPWVDDVVPWRALWQDLGQLSFDPAREWQLAETLRQKRFDLAIIFTSFSQSPHPPAFICQLADIPLRVGQSKETAAGLLTTELPSPPDELHQVERNLRLVEALGCAVQDRRLSLHIPQTARQSAAELMYTHGQTANGDYLLLNPWASCQARTYDPERFAHAARLLAESTRYPVVVTGLEKDRARSGALLQILGTCAIDLIGKTNLPELAALVENACLLLTNNTSTLHIADATGTPAVVLFSGTDLESQWGPRAAPMCLLRQPTPCRPCYAFTCPFQHECLDIAPEAVAAAGLELLARQSDFFRDIPLD